MNQYSLIQTKWNLPNAMTCHSTISKHIQLNKKQDCTIQSLAALNFINIQSAIKISEKLHYDLNKRPKLNAIIRLLSAKLNKTVNFVEYNNYIDGGGMFLNMYQYLSTNLLNNNCTMLSFWRNDGTGHSVVVRKEDDVLFYSDVQTNLEYELSMIQTKEPKIIYYYLYISGEDIHPLPNNTIDSATLLSNSPSKSISKSRKSKSRKGISRKSISRKSISRKGISRKSKGRNGLYTAPKIKN